jgi:hypothetical protein
VKQALFQSTLLICGFLTQPAWAASGLGESLFLTQAEQSLQRHFGHALTRLDAIIYFTPSEWQLWLNGNLVSPQHKAPEDLEIIIVQPTHVVLAQRFGEQWRRFSLQPRQAYDWMRDAVITAP